MDVEFNSHLNLLHIYIFMPVAIQEYVSEKLSFSTFYRKPFEFVLGLPSIRNTLKYIQLALFLQTSMDVMLPQSISLKTIRKSHLFITKLGLFFLIIFSISLLNSYLSSNCKLCKKNTISFSVYIISI